jgi:putative SOS response-associated peptidase YedK
MCGRYVMAVPPDEVARLFHASFAPGAEGEYVPSFNIPPTSQVLALGQDDGGRVLDLYRWGLVPSWMEDRATAPLMFNARAETVASKPVFSEAFTSRRVGVVAEGYYEWRRTPGTKLQPFFIHRTDGAPLVFAGLWESWTRDSRTLRSSAIITTAAGSDTEAVHDRMPVVLETDTLDLWLDRSEDDRDVLESLLRPSLRGTLRVRPVDVRVGKVTENDRDLIVPVATDLNVGVAEPLTLF